MDWLNLITDTGAPLAVAIIALLMLREEGRRNADALRSLLKEYLDAMRQHTAALADLTAEVHSHNTAKEE